MVEKENSHSKCVFYPNMVSQSITLHNFVLEFVPKSNWKQLKETNRLLHQQKLIQVFIHYSQRQQYAGFISQMMNRNYSNFCVIRPGRVNDKWRGVILCELNEFIEIGVQRNLVFTKIERVSKTPETLRTRWYIFIGKL